MLTKIGDQRVFLTRQKLQVSHSTPLRRSCWAYDAAGWVSLCHFLEHTDWRAMFEDLDVEAAAAQVTSHVLRGAQQHIPCTKRNGP